MYGLVVEGSTGPRRALAAAHNRASSSAWDNPVSGSCPVVIWAVLARVPSLGRLVRNPPRRSSSS